MRTHKLTQWELAAIEQALLYFSENAMTPVCVHADEIRKDLKELAKKFRLATSGEISDKYVDILT